MSWACTHPLTQIVPHLIWELCVCVCAGGGGSRREGVCGQILRWSSNGTGRFKCWKHVLKDCNVVMSWTCNLSHTNWPKFNLRTHLREVQEGVYVWTKLKWNHGQTCPKGLWTCTPILTLINPSLIWELIWEQLCTYCEGVNVWTNAWLELEWNHGQFKFWKHGLQCLELTHVHAHKLTQVRYYNSFERDSMCVGGVSVWTRSNGTIVISVLETRL